MPNKPVPWLKLWPELVDHEKFAQLTDGEAWTWVKLLAKSGQHPTRGRFRDITHAVVTTGRPRKHIQRLIQVRLLDEQPDGLWLHDWERWQRWRPEDGANGDGTPPDHPPITHGSTHDEHRNGNGSTPDGPPINSPKSVENREKTIEITPAAPQHPLGAAARRMTVVDDEFRDVLEDQFWETFGSREAVRDSIAAAMAHKARLKYSDLRAYLRNWVRHDAEQSQSRRGRGGRVTPIRGADANYTREQAEAEFGWMKDANA